MTLRRGAVILGIATALALIATPAGAAVTYSPNRFDDPLVGGSSCGPPAVAGQCSLRGAIAAAQAGDTVQLAGGTYELVFGSLNLSKKINIVGAGPTATTIRQTGLSRVIRIEGPVGLTMSGVTITGGQAFGGDGGDGGAGANGTGGESAYGAGINAGGPVTLTDVVVTGNSAFGGDGGDGGAGVAGAGGAGGRGGSAGGAGISGGEPLVLTRVAITDNVAQPGKAGVGGNAGTNGVGGKGGAGGSAIGAGVSMGFANLTATDVLIAGNTAGTTPGGKGGLGGTTSGVGGQGGQGEAADGGGLFSNGVMTLTNVTIAGNVALGSTGGVGGAARSGAATSGGAGGYGFGGSGGGVALFNGANGQFASVTIADNGTSTGAPGAGGPGSGGGASGATGGTSSYGGGNVFVYSAALAVRDTIFATGQSGPGSENCSFGGGGTLTTSGHNLDDRNECIDVAGPGDLVNTSAGLGPLQDNGGPTRTMALLPGSAAIKAGEASCVDAAGAPLSSDQRGLPRVSPCDIGAFEVQPPAPAAPPTPSSLGGDGEGQSPTAAVLLTALKLSPAKFLSGAKLKISFRLNRGAKVKFKLKRKTGKRLVVAAGAPRSFEARAGKNRRPWKPRGLIPGRYRLLAKPIGGKIKRIGFTVLKPAK